MAQALAEQDSSERSAVSGEKILVVDDESGIRNLLQVLLRRRGYQPIGASGVNEARKAIEEDSFDAIITDLMMPDGSGLDVLEAAKERDASTQVIVITAFTTTERAVEAMRQGAYDFLVKPFKNDVVLATLEKALDRRSLERENRSLKEAVHGTTNIIGTSAPMQALRSLIERAAPAQASVLITGESGTGKELVARALHDASDRNDAPFIVVNCGALPANLMESELFGHEKGSFTGADSKKEGLFRSADGGTLFLDEIGELDLALQVKLLRVLQERKVRPIGSSHESDVNVRVVAATNRDLEDEVSAGTFREDLFYRLNVIRVLIPPLRERPGDVRVLAQHLLRKHAARVGRSGMTISEDALAWLVARPFKGNVRELENLVERGVALAREDRIEIEDLEPQETGSTKAFAPTTIDLSSGFDLDAHLAEIERSVLMRALEETGGVRKRAAALLQMSFRSFRYRLAKYVEDE